MGKISTALVMRDAPPFADPSDNVFGVAVRQPHDYYEKPETLELSALARRSLSSRRKDDPAVFQLAKTWLRHCLDSHVECQRERTQLWYPTRLEIGYHETKLIDSADQQLTGPYATLSHCWGASKTFRLDNNTESKLRAGLPRAVFAPTFREAMVIAASLGFRYLWIDSYCIYQDSNFDWEAESSAMHRVYINSALKIGAAVGAEGSTSCFVDRASQEAVSFDILWKASSDSRREL